MIVDFILRLLKFLHSDMIKTEKIFISHINIKATTMDPMAKSLRTISFSHHI